MKGKNVKKKETPEEIQDEIFKKMPAEKKIHLVSELSAFCLKLNSFNGNIKPGKTPHTNN